MVRGLRYLANKIETFQFMCIAKWNRFLDRIKL